MGRVAQRQETAPEAKLTETVKPLEILKKAFKPKPKDSKSKWSAACR